MRFMRVECCTVNICQMRTAFRHAHPPASIIVGPGLTYEIIGVTKFGCRYSTNNRAGGLMGTGFLALSSQLDSVSRARRWVRGEAQV